MHLYFADVCPYAQRTRALFDLLETKFDATEVDLAHKTPAFLTLSPTGAVPLLDDDGFVLFESAVINEYLAEKLKWSDALSADVQQRAKERLAMKRYDDFIVPLFYRSLTDATALENATTWQREVAVIADATKSRPARSLLGLHLATHFIRFEWLAPQHPLVVELREKLGRFLTDALALPSIKKTTPDRAQTVAHLRVRFHLPA